MTPTPKRSSSAAGGIENRKADHIRINLDEDVGFDRLTVGFESYRFIHQALPELDFNAVDLTTRLFNKAPFAAARINATPPMSILSTALLRFFGSDLTTSWNG